MQKYIDNFLEVSTVKDGNTFALGRYENGVPCYGLYLKPVENTVLERIEKKARVKFQLEDDSENYSQEARVVFFQKLKDYLDKTGSPTNEKEENEMLGYLYNACLNSLTDLARWSKSNRSVYDEGHNEFSIVQLLSINNDKENISLLEKEIEDKLVESRLQSFSEFREWFNKNKTSILTKKQLAYLEDEQSILQNNRARMNKTICERINKKYSDSTIIEERVKKVKHRKETIRDIIIQTEPRHLINRLIEKMQTEEWLLDEVYSLSFPTCKMITQACTDIKKYDCYEDRVEEIRKKLNELNDYFSMVLDNLRKKI